jgi:outer membrane autotransporter protein
MKTVSAKRHPALTLSPLALAIVMCLPMQAQAFTVLVEKGAVVNGESVSGAQQNIGAQGTANHTSIEVSGTQAVFFGGVSNDATVMGRQVVQSGTSNRSIVDAGGSQLVSINGTANDTVLNGSTQTVQTTKSVANRTVINRDAVQTVQLSGRAVDTLINAGGVQVVTDLGFADNTRVLSGGEQRLTVTRFGGAVASDTHIEGGVQSVYALGTANNSTVSQGGRVDLYTGAQANGLVAEAGGTVNIMENGVKTVDSLRLDGGRLAFAPSLDGSFKTFTVNALSGSGSVLMSTDIASQQHDLLVVQGAGQASGDHTLIVADSGHEPANADGRLLLVDTQGGSAKFGLYGGHVDAGAFRYTLQQQGDDWVLASAGAVASEPVAPAAPVLPVVAEDPLVPADSVTPVNPVTATEPVKPLDPVTPSRPVDPAPAHLSKGANAAIAAHTAGASLWGAQMDALVQRLGELRMGEDDGGIWSRAIGKRLEVSERSSRAYAQDISGVEIGADKAFAVDGGKLYVGGMFGTARSDLDFGEGASGNIESRMLGVYATWLNDNGVYVDSVLKYSRFDTEIKTPTNLGQAVKGSYSSNGIGVNVEVGKRIKLRDGWFVEPQAQLTATRTEGASYTASNGLRVKTDDLDSLQSRVGAMFGRSLTLGNGMQAQPYAKASYITEYKGRSKVSVNGNRFDAELPGNRVALGFGAVLQLSERSKLSLDAEYAKGEGIEQPFGVSVGYRYLW